MGEGRKTIGSPEAFPTHREKSKLRHKYECRVSLIPRPPLRYTASDGKLGTVGSGQVVNSPRQRIAPGSESPQAVISPQALLLVQGVYIHLMELVYYPSAIMQFGLTGVRYANTS